MISFLPPFFYILTRIVQYAIILCNTSSLFSLLLQVIFWLSVLSAKNASSLAHLQKQGSSMRVRCHWRRTRMNHWGHWWTSHWHCVPYMNWGPRQAPPTWAQPHLDMHQHQMHCKHPGQNTILPANTFRLNKSLGYTYVDSKL